MTTRGRVLRFTTVSVAVVLCLTGFSTGTGHGGGSKSRSGSGGKSSSSRGGGGCSSSRQNHDTSTSTSGGGYRGGGHRGSTGTSSPSPTTQPATVRLVSCATAKRPYATVEVTNPNDRRRTFDVAVSFRDAEGLTIEDVVRSSSVPARETIRVRLALTGAAPRTPDHCQTDPTALPAT
ncbi:hypothetical protein VM636_17395 [Streptomyces sp. SCSIO 75703]|uniref:hypothetical protein n=1 Tax=unclassified Streptomyces TaxID=2593676 RepID=UPI0004C01740|nr:MULTISPECIES: hypothetical protein [unclassified Streptomyces]